MKRYRLRDLPGRWAVTGCIIVGVAGALACSGTDPVGGKGDATSTVRLHALSRKGPTIHRIPADITYTVDGATNTVHVDNLGQYGGWHIDADATSGSKVKLTVTATGPLDCDITFPGQSALTASGTNSCTVSN